MKLTVSGFLERLGDNYLVVWSRMEPDGTWSEVMRAEAAAVEDPETGLKRVILVQGRDRADEENHGAESSRET